MSSEKMLNSNINFDTIQSFFPEKKIQNIQQTYGGSINQTFVISFLNGEKYFIKLNNIQNKDNYIQEAFNLQYLSKKSSLRVPAVINLLEKTNFVALVLEYLEKKPEGDDFYFLFGRGLAELHKNSNDFFGWFQNNYIGSLIQSNKKIKKWSDFFVTERLEPLVKKCFDAFLLSKTDILSFENLYAKLDDIFPLEVPALLHGDLWTGNFMNTIWGAVIFDPASYYGHREMDIAMLNLFGTMPPSFYEGYHSVYPLEKDFSSRINICNLYPLLVHAVLFGSSYIYDIKAIIKKFR